MSVPREPLLFLKAPSALVGPNEPVVIPGGVGRVDYEGELAVVIGRRARRVAREEAFSYVYGFSCANDVTARDLQKGEAGWVRAKSYDTFCPVGPQVVRDMGLFSQGGVPYGGTPGVPGGLTIRTIVNGMVRQSSTTADMIFDIPTLISFISSIMTLEPGDIILTGTPPGVGPLRPGDTVEVEIEGIGRLTNPVAAE